MYTILTTKGQRVAIFALHVASVELNDNQSVCTIVMANGTQYVAAMQGEQVVAAIIDLLRNVNS